ncbi:UNVERIFIED_CONTAM: Lipase [Sesamum angustifolium]|uniref:Lipase n=1 Tax=Sesamum angustifolium TaxID=2727405 RepID=A0AAW2RLB6_9LAMI
MVVDCFRTWAGNVIYPDKESPSFLSFTGNLDKRVELDSSINVGDERYYAALSVMAAKASYENKNHIQSVVKDHWKMDFLGFYDLWNDYQDKATTQAFILHDKKNTIIVAFRGTEPFDADAWSSDFDISWYEMPGAGKIHGGFMKALGLQKSQGWPSKQDDGKPETAYYAVRRLLKEHLQKNSKSKFIITGHSLGGALAILFPAILAMHEESALLERVEGIYTFGQPRVGDEKFGEFMKSVIDQYGFKYFRVVYSYDLVPRLPCDDSTLMFKHFGTCIYYNSFYQGKVVGEEPDKNYFSMIWVISKLINAWWELIRSFVITYTKGAEYEEGSLLRMFRVIGLLVAGLPAHFLQDYVNATRLGSSNVFLPDLTSNGQKVLKMQ